MTAVASTPSGCDPESLLNLIDLGLVLLDADGRLVIWNDWMVARTGRARGEVLGRALDAVFATGLDRHLVAAIRAALEAGRSRLLSSSLHRHPLPLFARGGRAPAAAIDQSLVVRAIRGRDGRRQCLIEVADVSPAAGRDRALRARARTTRQQAAHLQAVFDSSIDGLIQFGPDGAIQSVNHSVVRLFGVPDAELVGAPITGLLPGVASRRSATGADPAAGTDPWPTGSRRELTGVCRDGRAVPVEVAITAVHDDTGTNYCAVVRDISERQRFEHELRAQNDTLRAQAAELSKLARRLEASVAHADRLRRQAEAANKSKTDFLARMSHELRTPLNAVLGFSELITDAGQSSDLAVTGPAAEVATARAYAHYIHESGTHLLSLVNDLLDLAKIEAGRMPLHRERIDLGRLATSCLALVSPEAGRRRLNVAHQLPSPAPILCGDERLVRQMLVNLLTNAVKFTPSGGAVTLSSEVRADGALIVTVSDTGVGMTPEDVEQALEHYGQVDNLLTRREQGTGLGLPLVKALIELHGGSLEIDSAPSAGTEVRLVFPDGAIHDAPALAETGAGDR